MSTEPATRVHDDSEFSCAVCGSALDFRTRSGPAASDRLRVFGRGARLYLLDSSHTLQGAFAIAEHEVSSTDGAEGSVETPSFCMGCRRYVCADCWNEAAARCMGCEPAVEGTRLGAPLDSALPGDAGAVLESTAGTAAPADTASMAEVSGDLAEPLGKLAEERGSAPPSEAGAAPSTRRPAVATSDATSAPPTQAVELEAVFRAPDPRVVAIRLKDAAVYAETDRRPAPDVLDEGPPSPPRRHRVSGLLGQVGARLRFRRRQPKAFGEPVAHPRAGEVQVSGYAHDCLVRGGLVLSTGRLSDLVAVSPSFALQNVHLVALTDGHETEVASVEVDRDEIVALEAVGPRGDPLLRRVTIPSPVVVRAGPYRIWGHVHAPPGADPITLARRRGSTLPLTDVRLRYLFDGAPVERDVGVLVVNLNLVESVISADRSPWAADSDFE